MKIIELLNKIANGEEVPKKIKIKDEIWVYDDDIDYKTSDDSGYLFEVYTRLNKDDLNEEVEIIEEDKKIEKIPMVNEFESNIVSHNQTRIKINEIIDKLNKEE